MIHSGIHTSKRKPRHQKCTEYEAHFAKGARVSAFMEVILNEPMEQRLIDYLRALEKVNEELINTLRRCIRILTQFKQMVDEPREWQNMLCTFQETIEVAEKTIEEKTSQSVIGSRRPKTIDPADLI
jgi:hypothetical protein